MNKKNTLLLAISAMLTAATMQAAPVSHTSDNLYAGFWQVDDGGDVARNYVAKIGLRSTIASQSSRTVLADLGSDLDEVFGSGWYGASTDTSKVYWGVFSWAAANASTNYLIGLNETANTDTATDINGVIRENLQASLGTANSGYSNFTGAYENLRLDTYNDVSGTGPLSVGVAMTGDANSFASRLNAATPWSVGGLNFANLQAWAGDQANGGNAGDQWIWAVTRKLNASDVVNNSSSVNQLTVESNGQVMVIPEPSTYALFGFGLLLMVMAYRRKVSV
jgi:hypothetical protein